MIDDFFNWAAATDIRAFVTIVVIVGLPMLPTFFLKRDPRTLKEYIVQFSVVYASAFPLLFVLYSMSVISSEEMDLSPEEQLAKERTLLEEEKRKREAEATRALAEARERVKQEAERQRREAQLAKERRAREIKEAQVRDEIARLQAERNKLREEALPRDVAAQIAEVNKQLEEIQTTAAHPSELKATTARNGEMSNASPAPRPSPGTSVDDQTRLVLSGLWLGACFFLQRIFEKLFKDKGYALLTVCAAGFLLAFFTANYFLLGGSVTGGLMGSVGERS
jgi:hypothetical protein